MTITAGPGRCPRCGAELDADALCAGCGPSGLTPRERQRLKLAALGMAIPLIVGGAGLALVTFGQLVAAVFINRGLLTISALGTVVSVLMIWLGLRILGTVQARLQGDVT